MRPEEIDIVINTHLHADHCGWNTRYVDGALVPTFANAEYIVMRDEWRRRSRRTSAPAPPTSTRTSRRVEASGRLRLLDGETRITDEVTVVPTPGHSAGHAAVVLASGGETALYIGDIAQVAVQLERTAWVSSFDVLPLVSLETKKRTRRPGDRDRLADHLRPRAASPASAACTARPRASGAGLR